MSGSQIYKSPLERLREYADLEVRHRSIPVGPLYFVLFLFVVLVTPIEMRFPKTITIFGGTTFGLSVLLFFLGKSWKWSFFANHRAFWSRLFTAVNYLSAANFGLFCAFTLARVELSWTSFCVILILFGICTGMVSAASPRYGMLSAYLLLMFLPPLAVNVFVIGGLRGYALGVLFAAYLGLLLWLGSIQNQSYWSGNRARARLTAMIDTVPGTLAWVSSELKYLGVNKQLSDLWGKHPADFIGKDLDYEDSDPKLKEMVSRLFSAEENQASMELQRTIGEKTRDYVIVAQKYNMDTEAVIVGLDVTDYKHSQQEVAMHRIQSQYSARLSSLGEVTEKAAMEMRHPIEKMKELVLSGDQKWYETEARAVLLGYLDKLEHIENALSVVASYGAEEGRKGSGGLISLKVLIEDAIALFEERFKTTGVDFQVQYQSVDVLQRQVPKDILQILLNLLNNSHDAVTKVPEKWIRLELEVCSSSDPNYSPAWIQLSVMDSGPGIPENLREKIFEPMFTTKLGQNGSGMGLAVARTIARTCGGRLLLHPGAPHTCFVLQVPDTAAAQNAA